MIYPVLIPAGRVANLDFPNSSVFFVVSATEGFDLKVGSQSKVPMSEGDGFGNPGAKQYSKATFYSAGAVDNVISIWISNSEYKSPLANVNNAVNVTATLAGTTASALDSVPNQFLNTIAVAAGGAVPLVALAGTKFRWALIQAVKTEAGAANVGSAWIGASGAAGRQPIEILAGTGYVLPIPVGSKHDFSNWFLKVDNDGDGVVVIYT